MYNGVWVKYESPQLKTKGVSHLALPFTLKNILRRIMEIQIVQHAKI